MKRYRFVVLLLLLVVLGFLSFKINIHPVLRVGDVVDSFNEVNVYFNGAVSHVEDRNTVDGYNVGLRYQCVEFVKRYYLDHYNHKFPNTYGHAKDFFNGSLSDGDFNSERGLVQFSNPSLSKPQEGDLLIMDAVLWNPYGHVAIVSNVIGDSIEIVQQNAGPFGSTREHYSVKYDRKKWLIEHDRILGWLRIK